MTLISSLKWVVFSSLSVSLVLVLVLRMGGGEVSAVKGSGVSFLVALELLSWPLSSSGSSSEHLSGLALFACFLTLLVVRLEEGVAFDFPLLQRC